MNSTPLRYPGGKSLMTPFFEEIIELNKLHDYTYAEPYAGGAGAAINLLLDDKVRAIKINDACPGVYSFWYFLLQNSNRFIEAVKKTEVNLEQWQYQRKIFKGTLKPSFELGFSTFFLSRTNRSGILGAGPIGGQNPEKQVNAKYKIDCRFNKEILISKLEKIIEKSKYIKVSNDDALTFLKKQKSKNLLVYLDPPYYKMGKELYLNFYKHNNHVSLSEFLKSKQSFKWILSYDNVQPIRTLYRGFKLYEFHLSYTAQTTKKGNELLTHSKDLKLPNQPSIKRYYEDLTLSRIVKVA